MSSWLQAEIVACDTLNKRAQMLKRFIRIAEHLMALNNFNSLFAMYCGLGANPIFRLKKTWAELNARTGAKLVFFFFERLLETRCA
jgi:son of sevenless-like protein